MLQRGMLVVVYTDPLTETKPEGKAILVERCRYAEPDWYEGRKVTTWSVRFLGESQTVERKVLEPVEVS